MCLRNVAQTRASRVDESARTSGHSCQAPGARLRTPGLPMFASTIPRAKNAPHVVIRLRALLAFSIALLQVVGALHFWLVPHAFSAALGGVVHVHSAAPSETQAPGSGRARDEPGGSLTAGTLSCLTDTCPFADAPAGTPLVANHEATAEVTFGPSALLAAADSSARPRARVLSSAPKTSPPS